MAHAKAKPEFEKGEYVSWKYGAGKATGYVVEKLTEPAKLGNKKFQASAEEPKYKIKSDKSGKMAIRNPETLEKIKDGEYDQEGGRNHDQSGAEDDDEEEDVHGEDGDEEKSRSEEAHEGSGDHDDEEEEHNAHEDGEQNGSRKRQKSASHEKTVDNVEAAEEPAWHPGGEEGENTKCTEKEHTNGKHENQDQQQEVEEDGFEGREETPHRMPHEEISQP